MQLIFLFYLNKFFILNISKKLNDISSLETEFIVNSLKNIINYFSLPEVKRYYGQIPVKIIDQTLPFTTQFFVDYIINPDYICRFLVNINWKTLMEIHKNSDEIYKEVIRQYCDYIKIQEQIFNKKVCSLKSSVELLISVEPSLTKHLTNFRKYALNTTKILCEIDWINYSKTVDYKYNNMTLLRQIFNKYTLYKNIPGSAYINYDVTNLINLIKNKIIAPKFNNNILNELEEIKRLTQLENYPKKTNVGNKNYDIILQITNNNSILLIWFIFLKTLLFIINLEKKELIQIQNTEKENFIILIITFLKKLIYGCL